MPRIKNIKYRDFLDKGMIDLIKIDHIMRARENIKGKHAQGGKVLLSILYYTGARPEEVLKLKAANISRDGGYVIIQMPPSKRGLARPIYLSVHKNDLVKEIWTYARSLPGEMLLFLAYIGCYKRPYTKRNGDHAEYIERTYKLRYHFRKWFEGIMDITPYFLRHNRFSSMMLKGADFQQIKIIKGSKSMESVTPYAHLSKEMAVKNAKLIE